MSCILDRALAWAERRLPKEKHIWIYDLRAEAEYIPSGLPRMSFQWSGIMAAAGHLLRIKYGPQKMGQFLLAMALIMFNLAILTTAAGIEDNFMQTAFYLVVPLYTLAASLAVINLRWMKRYTIFFSFVFAVMFGVLDLRPFTSIDVPVIFLRALTLEASFLMAGLFIAGSYLSWIEDARHG